MTTKKAPHALLMVGTDPATVREARQAINDILKAHAAEAVQMAALEALTKLAAAPQQTSITNCAFSL